MAHAPASLVARIGQRLRDRCNRLDDAILRWVLRAMLAASVGVFSLDVAQTYHFLPEEAAAPSAPGTLPGPLAEPLPAVRRGSEDKPGNPLRRTDPQLAGRMAFDLVGDGRLMATGTIEPGTAQAFAAEIAKRGSYVKTVVLHSPGGFVADALAMGRMIRQKKYATEVESGRYCASSCPLVLAG